MAIPKGYRGTQWSKKEYDRRQSALHGAIKITAIKIRERERKARKKEEI